MIEDLEKRGWEILNGMVEGDEVREFTYTGGRRKSVIDYVVGEEKVRKRVVGMKIEGLRRIGLSSIDSVNRKERMKDREESKGR